MHHNPTMTDIAERLRELSHQMHNCALDMIYSTHSSEDTVRHGHELMGAASIAQEWVSHIEKETK